MTCVYGLQSEFCGGMVQFRRQQVELFDLGVRPSDRGFRGIDHLGDASHVGSDAVAGLALFLRRIGDVSVFFQRGVCLGLDQTVSNKLNIVWKASLQLSFCRTGGDSI